MYLPPSITPKLKMSGKCDAVPGTGLVKFNTRRYSSHFAVLLFATTIADNIRYYTQSGCREVSLSYQDRSGLLDRPW